MLDLSKRSLILSVLVTKMEIVDGSTDFHDLPFFDKGELDGVTVDSGGVAEPGIVENGKEDGLRLNEPHQEDVSTNEDEDEDADADTDSSSDADTDDEPDEYGAHADCISVDNWRS